MLRNTCILLLFTLIFYGCKKEDVPQEAKEIPFKAYSSDTQFSIDSTLLADKSAGLKNFYRNSGYKTMWTDEKNRRSLIAFIKEIEPDGLYPEDYDIANLENYELKTKTLAECVEYDIMMTASFRKAARHLFKGKVAAKSVYSDWDLQAKKIDASKLLSEALGSNTIGQALDNCRPKHPVYTGLRKCYTYLSNLPDDSALQKIVHIKPILLNGQNKSLPAIKKRLAYWKDLAAADTSTVYDRKTFKAVKKFQARHGIYDDGVINSKTVEALNTTKKERMATVLVNMERWKWFAYDFGEKAVIINIPNYWLAVVENNKDTVEMHKIVVGKPERRTPVLFSRFNYLVINPTWTVPPTILKEDLVPSATEDRGYFAEKNMKIYDWGNNEITPEAWDPQLADQYYYVQGPGISNSLGEIKFNFNNSHTVYLHDTNYKALFARSQRALSSGCVRVQNPFDLALYLLEEEQGEWTMDKLMGLVAVKETKKLFLKKPAYVHQLYWTAWMDKGGLQFRNDIYDLDKALYKKLRK